MVKCKILPTRDFPKLSPIMLFIVLALPLKAAPDVMD